MWLNTAEYYEITNWVPHVLYTLMPGCRDKKNNKLSCDILPECLLFFAENLHFFFFNLNNKLKRGHENEVQQVTGI